LLPPELLPETEEIPGLLPLQLAQSPLFHDRFGVLRLFQPLMRSVPSPPRQWLDENATVESYAERRILEAVLKPALEPCFRLIVVLDAGVSMEVWRPLAEELRAILASSQAFRAVELCMFDPGRGLPEMDDCAHQSNLVLLLSDAAGSHWWNGHMFSHLVRWGGQAPVVLLNMLPTGWWGRTALGIAPLVSLSNTQPGIANSHYRVDSISRWRRLDLSVGFPLPVITLEGRAIAIWAGMAMGDSEMATTGVLIPEASERKVLLADFLLPPQAAADSDPAAVREAAIRRWKEFQGDASAQAQRLMMVMAAAPVLTLPIIRLLLDAKVKQGTTPLPMAEVLVSGLLRCRSARDASTKRRQLQFELEPGVASLLRERLSPGDTLDVIRAVTAVIERRWNQQGYSSTFEAILTDPNTPLPDGMEGILHFATVTAELLERLPGKVYRQFAAKLRQGAGLEPPDSFPAAQFSFEAIDVHSAQLQRIPEVGDLWFTSAESMDLPCQRFSFTTASIKPGSHDVRRHEATRSGFQEWLAVSHAPDSAHNAEPGATPQGLPLDMLHIPSGKFLMGSPPDEPERDDVEGPQHEVRLREFFLARTPITQAQWRAVAEWEREEQEDGELWPQELDPDPVARLDNPDRFRGNECPVVNVSWREAMAFCQRLRLRTGKNYTLPSEAQWEYACRAGTTTAFHFGETLSSELANYDASVSYANGPKGEYRRETTKVGLFPANAWGLQDMHGNVWEWCLDHWHNSYEGAPEDGSAWLDQKAAEDELRLLRGGSWFDRPRNCRSAYRFGFHPGLRPYIGGFRVCCLPQDLILYP
jgi:formylglycine-generating enzyme required for sulfatase activity